MGWFEKLRWHAQDLNDAAVPKRGGMLRHGRAWLNWGDEPGQEARVEWVVPGGWPSLHLTLNDMEDRFLLRLGLGLFTVYVGAGCPAYPSRAQEWGLSLFKWRLRLDLGANPAEWSCDDPWWWSNSVDLRELVFGKVCYSRRDLATERVEVAMPEGRYPATVTLSEDSWTSRRPILGRALNRMIRRAELVPDTPIPYTGKGEDSWNVGDDALHSLVCPATDSREAAKKAADSVMERRWRYGGGYDWKPAKGWQHEGTA